MANYTQCRHCNGRIELINFTLGAEWMHWPTPYGNYNTREKYQHCRAAIAEPHEPCAKCGSADHSLSGHRFAEGQATA